MKQRTALWNALAILAAIALVFFWFDPAGRAPGWGRFFARLHPVFVHLPIGILLFGGILAVAGRFRASSTFEPAIKWSLLIGGWSAVAAAAAGSWLIQMGAYPTESLDLHRIIGFLLPLAAAGVLLLHQEKIVPLFKACAWVVLLGGLMVGGHLGGELSHGKGYAAEYAPGFLKPLIGEAQPVEARFSLDTPDQTTIWEGIVLPVFETRCTSCHGDGRRKGGLDLTTAEAVASHETDDEDPPLIVEGDPMGSYLVQRISLPEGHRRIMPPFPDAQPLSHSDIELIKWWVASGAGFEGTIAGTPAPDGIRTLLAAYGMEPSRLQTVNQDSTAASPRASIP